MAIVGILSTVALYLIGVPGALFLGILTGLLAFVPLVGSIVSAIPPLLLAFVVGPTTVLWVLLAYVAIQQIEGNLVEPLIMQKTASLHPAAVVTVVTVLGAAFGVLGSILAVSSAIVAAILVKELWFRRLEEAENEPDRKAETKEYPRNPARQ
jgi:predicted PurR-regulated permease PerM